MDLKSKIDSLVTLGNYIQKGDVALDQAIEKAKLLNPWFTQTNSRFALQAVADHFLSYEKLENWLEKYPVGQSKEKKKVGLVLAGNIPMVGFHDILCCFLSDNISMIKYSEKDNVLIPFLLDKLGEIDEKTRPYFEKVEKLAGFDAVIATGSNNSSRYFEAYFGKYPNIIRKNRNGVAVLTGEETEEDLKKLGIDIFSYFGLGCRNVSKLYVPENYDFSLLLETLHTYNEIIHHNKYKNNFDYNYALFLLNKQDMKNNGCLILKEEKVIASRIASVHYEYYKDLKDVVSQIQETKDDIQCIISGIELENIPIYDFGKAQSPELLDYADGVDTMEFLTGL